MNKPTVSKKRSRFSSSSSPLSFSAASDSSWSKEVSKLSFSNRSALDSESRNDRHSSTRSLNSDTPSESPVILILQDLPVGKYEPWIQKVNHYVLGSSLSICRLTNDNKFFGGKRNSIPNKMASRFTKYLKNAEINQKRQKRKSYGRISTFICDVVAYNRHDKCVKRFW